MFVIEKDTFAEVYKSLLMRLFYDPDYVSSPRGMKINEVLDSVFTIRRPEFNLFLNEVRQPNLKYLKTELELYFKGKNDIDSFAKASRFWAGLANSDGTINSAYGFLIFKEYNNAGYNQWNWAYNALMEDSDTRQAFMHFNKPAHQFPENKDQVCTLNYIINIRDNKLNASVIMRSSDLYFGLVYDVPYFTLLQISMLHLLRKSGKYPDLELGIYTHHSVSQHIYERNFEELDKSLSYNFYPDKIPELDASPVDQFGNFIGFANDDFSKWMKN